MRIATISCAVLVTVLAGCSGSQAPSNVAAPSTSVDYRAPPPTDEQIRAQAKLWADCSWGKIVELDDGRSDAGVVATAVTSACRPYYKGRPNDDYPMIVEAILKVRANKAQNKQPAAAKPQPMIPPNRPTSAPPPMIPSASQDR